MRTDDAARRVSQVAQPGGRLVAGDRRTSTNQDDFSVVAGDVNGRTVVSVTGELDIATVPALEEVLDAARGPVLVDVREVTFMDARAIGALVTAHRRIGLSVRHASPHCRRLLDLCGLASLLAD